MLMLILMLMLNGKMFLQPRERRESTTTRSTKASTTTKGSKRGAGEEREGRKTREGSPGLALKSRFLLCICFLMISMTMILTKHIH